MGIYKYIRKAWEKPKENLKELYRQRLIDWRKENSIVRIDKPTRLDRARSLGYKAKQGIIMARVRVSGGGRMREQIKKGRRPKHARRRKIVRKSYRWIAEERAGKRFKNCEVLNSYNILEDSKHKWFEIILVERGNPVINSDKQLEFISNERGRVFRGKTSAGKRSRGLRNKGKGAEKLRPSRKANFKK